MSTWDAILVGLVWGTVSAFTTIAWRCLWRRAVLAYYRWRARRAPKNGGFGAANLASLANLYKSIYTSEAVERMATTGAPGGFDTGAALPGAPTEKHE